MSHITFPLFPDILIEQFAYSNFDIGGDFNLVQDIDMEKSGGRKSTNFKARDLFCQKMNYFDHTDVWRLMIPNKNH